MCFFTRLLPSLTSRFSFQIMNSIKKLPKLFSFENCGLLCYCAASNSNSLPTFRDHLSVPSSTIENTSLVLDYVDYMKYHTSCFCVASSSVFIEVSVSQSQKPAVTKTGSITLTFILSLAAATA